jgi:hypothetical protein
MEFIRTGTYSVGTSLWSPKTDGSKKMTKPQIKALEKTGMVTFDWTDTNISIKSHVDVHRVGWVGQEPPYKKMVVEYE